jgi:hypothetical protein
LIGGGALELWPNTSRQEVVLGLSPFAEQAHKARDHDLVVANGPPSSESGLDLCDRAILIALPSALTTRLGLDVDDHLAHPAFMGRRLSAFDLAHCGLADTGEVGDCGLRDAEL